MQSTLAFRPAGSSDFDLHPPFNVVIAYEDLETGKHAKLTYDYLMEHLGEQCSFSNQMWKFDVLGIPKLCEMAARDAAAADIIILSMHGHDDVPQPVRDWIELWLGQQPNAIALVALFDVPCLGACQFGRIRSYLADVARRGNMELFSQPNDWPGHKPEAPLTPDASQDLSNRAFTVIAGAVQHDSFPRWGINE